MVLLIISLIDTESQNFHYHSNQDRSEISFNDAVKLRMALFGARFLAVSSIANFALKSPNFGHMAITATPGQISAKFLNYASRDCSLCVLYKPPLKILKYEFFLSC